MIQMEKSSHLLTSLHFISSSCNSNGNILQPEAIWLLSKEYPSYRHQLIIYLISLASNLYF